MVNSDPFRATTIRQLTHEYYTLFNGIALPLKKNFLTLNHFSVHGDAYKNLNQYNAWQHVHTAAFISTFSNTTGRNKMGDGEGIQILYNSCVKAFQTKLFKVTILALQSSCYTFTNIDYIRAIPLEFRIPLWSYNSITVIQQHLRNFKMWYLYPLLENRLCTTFYRPRQPNQGWMGPK